MSYEIHINGTFTLSHEGELSMKKLSEYLILNDLLVDNITYPSDTLTVYKLKDNPNKGYGWGV